MEMEPSKSLKIYLDDCAYSRRLRQLLEDAGHKVVIPAEANPPLIGAPDEDYFEYARHQDLIVLTYDAGDFLDLHRENGNHSGIFAVFQDNNVSKDMTYQDIVRAIGNLQATSTKIAAGFWILNSYRW